jgi:hypothetical protein
LHKFISPTFTWARLILLLIIEIYTKGMSHLKITTHRLNGRFFGPTEMNDNCEKMTHKTAIDRGFTVLRKNTMT